MTRQDFAAALDARLLEVGTLSALLCEVADLCGRYTARTREPLMRWTDVRLRHCRPDHPPPDVARALLWALTVMQVVNLALLVRLTLAG